MNGASGPIQETDSFNFEKIGYTRFEVRELKYEAGVGGGIDWEDIELTNLTTRASRFKGTDSLNPLYLCRQVFSLLLQFH